ncbi:uncharacterized protein LOC120203823 [Hibiscus syriacus]|uniref:uncharacterized protein LOC120203823 n=1 Tax=Hibiscus syriacus TaxID=106335 RepID=UPI00192065E9|nr:uncharacterized protein LOC120203823 [Hibiscus syriacus]
MGKAIGSRGLKICCGVTAILILITAIVFTALALTLFKPRNPEIAVYPQGFDNIDFVTVNNCNYWSFKFKNTVGFINYRGAVVATVPIEQSSVPSRGKLNISTVADFKVERLIMNTTFWADVLSGSVNFSSVATMHGKVTMFKLLKIHASFPSKCDISIFIPTRSVQSICKMKVKV